MPTLKIPPVLRNSTDGEREVEGNGVNVGEGLRDLADKHPATQPQLFGQDGQLNRYVNVYLNDEDVRVLQGLQTEVKDADTLVILPAMAGGAPYRPRTSSRKRRTAAVRPPFVLRAERGALF